ncbi:MAG: flagellar basal body-associated FliL family protein [Gammaproteobacteria bacterium]|nr:flagellar basal body-associated FliL family protein [Gammaproteobacteria bacterium]MBU1623793.1 flagellar basal body-associated FliL family protein [Gammaproteobacteria bacterium]MBU1982010.1 flagellar basal body-associated FliL family protein [Gammaproteobacteria bacterium]
MASKPAKPAPAAPEEGAPAPAKSNKLLIIIIGLLVLIIAGGAGWVLTRGQAPAEEHAAAEEHKAEPMKEPKFIPLGEKFTVNLQREEGDQYLQAGITLKILDPELELKIKNAMPEIRSKLLFLLSSKKPSELVTSEGKAVLVEQVIAEVDGILGFGSEAPAAPAEAHAPAAHAEAAHGESAPAATAPAAPAAPKEPKTTGVVDVLFSDFIIQ